MYVRILVYSYSTFYTDETHENGIDNMGMEKKKTGTSEVWALVEYVLVILRDEIPQPEEIKPCPALSLSLGQSHKSCWVVTKQLLLYGPTQYPASPCFLYYRRHQTNPDGVGLPNSPVKSDVLLSSWSFSEGSLCLPSCCPWQISQLLSL